MSKPSTLVHPEPIMQNSKPASNVKKLIPVAVIIGGLALAYLFGLQDYFSLNYLAEKRGDLEASVAARPFLSALTFFAIYTLAVAFSFPAASVLTIFAGFLFGWFQGGVMIVLAATLGATILFLAARSTFGGFLREKLGSKASAFAEGLRKDAFSYLLVLRLAPIFPFFVINVAPALFDVKTRDYVLATFLGIIPGTFAYAWLGAGLGSVLDAAKAAGTMPSIGDLVTPQITIAFFALAVVAAIPVIIRKVRQSK